MRKRREGPTRYEPPSPARVAKRALVLSAVVWRANLERNAAKAGAKDLHARVLTWIGDLDLASEMELGERLLLKAPLGLADPRTLIDASWRAEGLAVLAWGLDRHPMPAYDELADPKGVAGSLGFLAEAGRELLLRPHLRPEIDLEDFANTMVALHWRLREFSKRREPMDFRKTAAESTSMPLRIAGLKFAGTDLALRGVALAEAPRELFRTAFSIAQERLLAVNWLRGDHPVYSEVRNDA